MAFKSLIGVSVILQYTKGSFKFSSLKPTSTNERLYEFGDAVNSLQDKKAKYIDKALCYRVAMM